MQYTRCPQCETAFKVTKEMLAMAHGRVRCGACLEVFVASDHLLKVRSKSSTQPESDSSITVNSESIDSEQNSSTENSASNTKIEKGFSSIELAQIKAESENSETSNEDTIKRSPQDFSSQTALTASDIDSSESENLDPENSDLENSELDLAVSDSEHEEIIDNSQNNIENTFQLIEDKPDSESVTNEVDSAQVADVVELESENLEPSSSLSDSAESDLTETDDFTEDAEILQKIEEIENLDIDDFNVVDNSETNDPQTVELEELELSEDNADQAEEFTTEPQDSKIEESIEEEVNVEESSTNFEENTNLEEAIDENISEQLELAESDELDVLSDNLTEQINDTDIQPDPLEEFEGRVEKKKTSLRTLVILVSVSTLLIVLFFKFWNNRQELAWDESWGGFTEAVCGALPCDLKPRRDITKIKLRQRIVTPSEEQEDILDIKILMTNEAKFEQPYPIIVIGFSNTLGERVAQKEFTVNDYFPEKNEQMMPAGAEVHIAFSIDLPHPDALGFEFDFR